jgi:hypothetical protein
VPLVEPLGRARLRADPKGRLDGSAGCARMRPARAGPAAQLGGVAGPDPREARGRKRSASPSNATVTVTPRTVGTCPLPGPVGRRCWRLASGAWLPQAACPVGIRTARPSGRAGSAVCAVVVTGRLSRCDCCCPEERGSAEPTLHVRCLARLVCSDDLCHRQAGLEQVPDTFLRRRRRRLRAELAGHVVHEGGVIAIGMKRIHAVAKQGGDALKVNQPGRLGDGVLPRA